MPWSLANYSWNKAIKVSSQKISAGGLYPWLQIFRLLSVLVCALPAPQGKILVWLRWQSESDEGLTKKERPQMMWLLIYSPRGYMWELPVRLGHRWRGFLLFRKPILHTFYFLAAKIWKIQITTYVWKKNDLPVSWIINFWYICRVKAILLLIYS